MKKILLVLFILGVAIAAYAYWMVFNSSAFGSQEEATFDIIIDTTDQVSDVSEMLVKNGLKKSSLFTLLADQMNYRDDNLKPGLYEINSDMNLPDLIRHLRAGRQKPVSVTINSIRTIEDLANKITRNLQLDSISYLSFLEELKKEDEDVMAFYIPDTYSVFWNISAPKLHQRMVYESEKFWKKNNRLTRAESKGFKPEEVYVLASIVEQESTLNSEKPMIASVYLNRLKRQMKLQADPTVVFAVGDFSLRRVLNVHLKHDSPYNTYINTGLPPGPICMPSKSSIDAVLNPADTDYIFFCAKPGYQNGHAFASTLRQHLNNARTYRTWLSSEGIR